MTEGRQRLGPGNNDDGSNSGPAESIEIEVEVGEYNNIEIVWLSKGEKEKTLVGGGLTEYYVQLTNRGNIWNQEASVQVNHEFPTNISVNDIVVPESGNYLFPESYGFDFTMVVRVQILVQKNTTAGVHEFDVVVWTPGRAEPSGGHKFVGGRLIIEEKGGIPPTIDDPDEKNTFQVMAVFGGGFIGLIMVMGSIFYHLVLKTPIDEQDWKVDEGWALEDEWNDDHEGTGYEVEEPLTPERLQRPLRKPEATIVKPAVSSSNVLPTETPHIVGHAVSPGNVEPQAKVSELKTAPVPKGGSKVHVTCPKCSVRIKVSSQMRPLSVKCPKCSTRLALKGKSEQVEKGRGSPIKTAGSPVHVNCPTCEARIRVTNPKRPLTIKCSRCDTKLNLRGKQGSVKPSDARLGSSAAHAGKAAKRITCPNCSTRMKITNPARPLKVNCPSCSTRLNVK